MNALLHIICFAGDTGPGVHACRFDTETGTLRLDATVVAFAIAQASGALRYFNRRPARGKVPCYVDVSADGRFVLVANFSSGTLSVLPLAPACFVFVPPKLGA